VVGSIANDAEQAQTYCANEDGSVALASEAQLAAFADALRPVEATIAMDAMSKQLIAQIRAQAKDLPGAVPTVACGNP